MRAFMHSGIAVPLISIMTVFAFSAQAQEPNKPHPKEGQAKPAVQTPRTGTPPARTGQVRGPQGGSQDGRFARGRLPERNFGGHPYHGRMAWEGGRWRHEAHNGRYGWWWDVGGVWYFYPEQMDGPPAYISEDYADDVYPAAGGYPPPPPAYVAAPPPPPPPPDPAASAVGGAVVGGLLGGLLTGRASGAAAGAVIGGATGAIAGATAASRPGYYLADGNCYYRYPSGQYVAADPRWCY